MRLGAALGTALKRGARVVASRESPPACRMIKRAMITGRASRPASTSPTCACCRRPSNRHLLKSESFDAGVHVGVSAADPEVVADPVLRAARHPADARRCRRRSRSTSRGRSRGASAPTDVGTISYPARAAESYAADLLSSLDVDAIRERGFRIVVDYGYSAASLVLPLVLGPLGVEAVAAHAFTTGRHTPTRAAAARGDRRRRRTSCAPSAPTSASSSTAPAERLYLVDEHGAGGAGRARRCCSSCA